MLCWDLTECLRAQSPWPRIKQSRLKFVELTRGRAVHAVEAYLKQLDEIYRTGGGTGEESYYGALEILLNEVGKGLKPKVRCIPQIKNVGAGEPDFGLFTSTQFQRARDERPPEGALPERGVIEAKGWDDDASVTAETEQVSKYCARYGLVLVTNYRDFILVGKSADGEPIRLEPYSMAESEDAFLELIKRPRKTATEQGDRLLEFFRRVLLHAAPLADPEDLARFLASYAREARTRVEKTSDLPALNALKGALEEALGMKFEGDKGEHFFRATLVQTLFYGVFSSWVLWCRENPISPGSLFRWHEAGWTLHVPMVKSLFEQIATQSRLKPLGIAEVLDWAELALNRVDRASFFTKFEEENAVQYFYEPFLKEYDPALRKDLGVWYTPVEIVQYQVERIDRVLREELGLVDGLADDQVVVLDPCCGTGTYLVEVLRRIHRTLDQKGGSALVAHKLKCAAMDRIFGFEILPAPFVISHMQIGLMLRRLGAPIDPDSDDRAGVYLTNALTGWEPPAHPKDTLPLFPELMEERDAANRVKCETPILVVLGNPPYNAYAGTSPDEEHGLVEPYKEGLTTAVKDGGWGIKKFNLDDLYVRFFRIAERRIAKSGKGIVSYISNFSYLGDPSFVVMRNRLLGVFNRIWIDCMNGDSRETGKKTPDGRPDPSVFSTERNPVGIRVGTAICVMVKKEECNGAAAMRFRDYWGVAKRQDLLASLKLKRLDRRYRAAEPSRANRYSFRPLAVDERYLRWPCVIDLCAEPPTNGLMEKRGGALIDIDREALVARMKTYYDSEVDWGTLHTSGHPLTKDAARYVARECRSKVLDEEGFDEARIQRYAVRPFDLQWCYYSPVRPLWNEPRPSYWAQCWEGNTFFVTRPAGAVSPEGVPAFFSSILGDNDFQRGHAYYFPVRLRASTGTLFEGAELDTGIRANLSRPARNYLQELGLENVDTDHGMAEQIWMHALAVCFSPAYLSENEGGLRQDWPRVPLPASKSTLLKSIELGRILAALLNTEEPVIGVTAGEIRPEISPIAVISKAGGGALDPNAGELELMAGWGHSGKGGACMPGKGKSVVRRQDDRNLREAFGEETMDVYLNDMAYWANVPKPIWDFYVGGYQVIKKWLSYRDKAILGRGLSAKEVEYVTEMARRVAAIILLHPALNANYESIKKNTWKWPSG
jgi:hypothetical protein